MIKAIDTMKPGGTASLACDSVDDVTDLPAFAAENNLQMGSTCLCISTSDVYGMKSDNTWVKL